MECRRSTAVVQRFCKPARLLAIDPSLNGFPHEIQGLVYDASSASGARIANAAVRDGTKDGTASPTWRPCQWQGYGMGA